MIKFYSYYNETILNLSGIAGRTELAHRCKWMQRCEVDEIRRALESSTIMTEADCQAMAQSLVEKVKLSHGIKTVWLKPIRTNPLLYSYVENAFLDAGYYVASPAEEYTGRESANQSFAITGWWIRHKE